MVVGVGGKIGDDLHERVQELLGDMEEAETGQPEPVKVEPHDHAHVKVHTKASDQAHICIGVHSYPLEHPDRYVLQVLSTVLGGGMSSRLFTEVRERRGLAYYVYGLNHSYTDAGSLYAQAGVDINRIDDAVTTVAAELQQDRRRAGAGRRAREGQELREGPVRPPARDVAGTDHVRAAPRGAWRAGRPIRRRSSRRSAR